LETNAQVWSVSRSADRNRAISSSSASTEGNSSAVAGCISKIYTGADWQIAWDAVMAARGSGDEEDL